MWYSFDNYCTHDSLGLLPEASCVRIAFRSPKTVVLSLPRPLLAVSESAMAETSFAPSKALDATGSALDMEEAYVGIVDLL